jgi:hypothetical protein
MGVVVKDLKSSHILISKGITKVILKYNAVVDKEEDNPVKLRLYIDPLQPVYLINNKKRVKSLETQEMFSTSELTLYTWEIKIKVDKTPVNPEVFSLKLEATDSLRPKVIISTALNMHYH